MSRGMDKEGGQIVDAIHIGCQTVIWGARRGGEYLTETLRGVAEAGYEGVEIGARFLDLEDHDRFRVLLNEHGLTLAGLRSGAPCREPSCRGSEHDLNVEVSAKFQSQPQGNLKERILTDLPAALFQFRVNQETRESCPTLQ